MSSWFNNFFSRIFPKSTEDEENIHTNDDRIQIEENKQTKIESKVFYQYPSGQFRFPLIPDSETNATNNTRVHRREQKEAPREKLVKPVVEQEVKKVEKKRPFRPTDVPSPIYGFNKRNFEETEDIPNVTSKRHYETEANRYNNIMSSLRNNIENHETVIIENSTIEEFEPLNAEIAEIEEINFYNDEFVEVPNESNDKEHEMPQANLNEVLENECTEKTIETNESLDEGFIDTQPINETKDTAANHSQQRIKSHSSSENKKDYIANTIPYNVIMLKKDKNNIEKKEIYSTIPPLHLLNPAMKSQDDDHVWLEEQRQLLDETLSHFNVRAKVVNYSKGPSVTRFEVQPEMGVKVNKITNLSDDIKLSLAAKDIRIEAPIPGKSVIGIEVPNQKSRPVNLREIIGSQAFLQSRSPLTVSLGLDISGEPVVTDINKMPHGLIAGATGSGKSVCINSFIISLLYKATPDQVRLLLIDPKMVELAPYNGLPHLVSPVITDVKAATAALKWAVDEMERRYEVFSHEGVRDINRFNEKMRNERLGEKMPYIVIIIDELADLMMVSPQDVEESICRIAQKARACGIHLLLATQRPSVDVITGLIKSNIPTRISFSVSSQVDSRTIIDISGAEKLLGRGDMLLLENGSSKPVRLQGNFVSDEEIDRVTQFVKSKMKPSYLFVEDELVKQIEDVDSQDDLFEEACAFVLNQQAASASSLQRRFHIGYNRAARLIDIMEAKGIISEAKGSKPRDVLVSEDKLNQIMQ